MIAPKFSDSAYRIAIYDFSFMDVDKILPLVVSDIWWNRAKSWWKLALMLISLPWSFLETLSSSSSSSSLSVCFTVGHKSSSSMLVFKPCENLLLPPKIFTTTTTTNSKPHLHHHKHDVKLLHFPSLKAHFRSTLSSSSPLSSPSEEEEEEEEEEDSSPPLSLTTTRDFLMESGGLSYKQAIHVIRVKPTLLRDGGRRPRLVIAYFESSIGFSKTHLSEVICKSPRLLVADVEKTLKPKIQLLQDFGFSKSDIAELIFTRPNILNRSLKTHLKPALDLIKSFVKSDEDLIETIKRNNSLAFSTSCRKSIEPNIHVLRQHGVPDSEILHLVSSQFRVLTTTPKVFKSIVERIKSLGFKPETRMFSTAVATMSRMKKTTWDSKMDLLKGMGWSELQILDSFRRFPRFFTLSGERMKEGVEFFNKSLSWDASVLSRHPIILNFSLKTRIIPRYAVLECLMSKEIIKDDTQFINMLKLSETMFLSRYIFRNQEQLPYLYEVYEKECMLGCEEEEDNGEIAMTV